MDNRKISEYVVTTNEGVFNIFVEFIDISPQLHLCLTYTPSICPDIDIYGYIREFLTLNGKDNVIIEMNGIIIEMNDENAALVTQLRCDKYGSCEIINPDYYANVRVNDQQYLPTSTNGFSQLYDEYIQDDDEGEYFYDEEDQYFDDDEEEEEEDDY